MVLGNKFVKKDKKISKKVLTREWIGDILI